VQFVAFDKEYVEKLAAGESDTERHFVAYFGELLGIKLRMRVASSYLVEEIRQEVFLRVFRLLRKPNGVRQPERLGPLVNAICDHVVMEYRRSGEREPEPLESDFDTRDEAADVETELLGVESAMAVRNVLETLPHREQLLLRAVYFDDQNRDAICKQQGVDREYLRVLLHRARLEFKERYLKYTQRKP
jgi:RNA polymerase sigma-70 factor (ECF subfamily)